MKKTPTNSGKSQRVLQRGQSKPEQDELAATDISELPTPSKSQTPRKPKTKISDFLCGLDEPDETPKSEKKRKNEDLEDELNSDAVTPPPKKVRISKKVTPKSAKATPLGRASRRNAVGGIKQNKHSQSTMGEQLDNLTHATEGSASKQGEALPSSLKEKLEEAQAEQELHLEQPIDETKALPEQSTSQIEEDWGLRRSARTRKPRLNGDSPNVEAKSIQKPPPTRKAAISKAKTNQANKKWESSHVVTDSKSPLIHTNLMKILYNPKAWTALSREEQRELLTYLPTESNPAKRASELADLTTEDEIPNLAAQRLRSSEKFKSDIRQFQEDLMDGRLDPAWLEAATNASRRRETGEFDDWKTKERELYWGMNLGIEKDETNDVETDELNGEAEV